MDSKVRHQLELLPSVEPHIELVTPELINQIRRRPTLLAAWNFAQDFACLEDKQCYGPIGIDPSHWGKIRSGKASPPADQRFVHYMDVVRNEIPLIWLSESRGYDFLTMRKHRSDHERRIAELEMENRDLKRSFGLLADALKSRA
jgi:hypothetical protein